MCSAVVNHLFFEMQPHMGALGDDLSPGKLVSTDQGKATSYALNMIQERGVLFVQNNPKFISASGQSNTCVSRIFRFSGFQNCVSACTIRFGRHRLD